jgi:hypothetical protein
MLRVGYPVDGAVNDQVTLVAMSSFSGPIAARIASTVCCGTPAPACRALDAGP